MWTASIADKKIENGVMQINISFSDGELIFNEITIVRTPDSLDRFVRIRLKELEDLYSFHDSLKLGSFSPTPEVIPEAPEPDPLQKKLGELQTLKLYSDLGLISEADPKLIQTRAEVQNILNGDA